MWKIAGVEWVFVKCQGPNSKVLLSFNCDIKVIHAKRQVSLNMAMRPTHSSKWAWAITSWILVSGKAKKRVKGSKIKKGTPKESKSSLLWWKLGKRSNSSPNAAVIHQKALHGRPRMHEKHPQRAIKSSFSEKPILSAPLLFEKTMGFQTGRLINLIISLTIIQ